MLRTRATDVAAIVLGHAHAASAVLLGSLSHLAAPPVVGPGENLLETAATGRA